MDWYLYAKFFHISFAAMWIGGGVCLILLGIAAIRARRDDELVRIVLNVVYLSTRFFIPASILTVVFGVLMVWLGHSFAELWIVLGLVGFAVTFATGVLILKPASERISAMYGDQGVSSAVVEASRDFLRHAAFDYVMIFLVVAIMVLKPTAADRILLAAMAVILVVSGALLLMPARRPRATAAG